MRVVRGGAFECSVCLRQEGWQCPEGNSGDVLLKEDDKLESDICILSISVSLSVYGATSLLHLFIYFGFSQEFLWMHSQPDLPGRRGQTLLTSAGPWRRDQSRLPVLGPGKAEPEENLGPVSGQWVIWISLLKSSLFAWLPEEGSYPSKSRAISQSSLKQVFQAKGTWT